MNDLREKIFLGRYRIEREVGRGGMAVVYKGEDFLLGREVAIKVLHPHLAQRTEARFRFAREARIIAKLRHPNIVEVYDYSGEESDTSFIITEYIDGITLSEFLELHKIRVPEIAAMIITVVARALAHAHERGVIHRDVKPENIMIRKDGVLKLTDFGIAHVVDMEHLTVTGMIIGSPAHMSPEQVDGRALDARTDIFSLGTLFFMTAAGDLPFKAETASALLKAIAEAKVPDIRFTCPAFPDNLYSILMKMMARDPADRFQTADQVADALESAIASVGLGSPTVELPRFFVDPNTVTDDILKRVVEGRIKKARVLLDKKRHALALRELDSILYLDQDCEEAKKLLDKAKKAIRKRNVSRLSFLVAGIVGIIIGLIAGWYHFISQDQELELKEPKQDGLSIDQHIEIQTLGPFQNLSLKQRRGIVPIHVQVSKFKMQQDQKVKKQVLLVVQAHPPAVRIMIDGKFFGEGTTGEILLEEGQHVIHLSHPSCSVCKDTTYNITLDSNNPPKGAFRFSITYKDALLTVKGPQGGIVLVNGIKRGMTNEVIHIPMNQPNPILATISVLVDGQQYRSAKAALEPGKETILNP